MMRQKNKCEAGYKIVLKFKAELLKENNGFISLSIIRKKSAPPDKILVLIRIILPMARI